MKHKNLRRALLIFTWLFIFVGIILYFELNHDRLFSKAADEAASVQTLRTIFERQRDFRSRHGCFASDLRRLRDVALQNRGYTYSIEVGTKMDCVDKYFVLASPSASMLRRNARFFAIDENATIRFEWNRPPTAESQVVQ